MGGQNIGLGIIGLGRGFVLTLPSLIADSRIRLVAATDPRQNALEQFEHQFDGKGYSNLEQLCDDPEVDAVYIASSHQFHLEHALTSAAAGKHVLIEKPMALTVHECEQIVQAASQNKIHVVIGPSHGMDQPILAAKALIDSGEYGALKMMTALNFTDFIYRPRRVEELDSALGGGVVLSQAAHHFDILRLLASSPIASIRASLGNWDSERLTDGAYAALVHFQNGVVANLTYSGYAHFSSDVLCNNVSELGYEKQHEYVSARNKLNNDELSLKEQRAFGADANNQSEMPASHEHFGVLLLSCEKADIRPLPNGVEVHGDTAFRFDTLEAPTVPRVQALNELFEAVVNDVQPKHDASWGLQTVLACLALQKSGVEGREIFLS